MSKLSIGTKAALAYDWWWELQPREADGHRGDRGALARLRRCTTPLEAAAEPVTHALFRLLKYDRPEWHLSRIAVLASVLAHVRENCGQKIAEAIGKPPNGTAPLISSLRLRRLLATKEDDKIMIAFRRVVARLHHTANVSDLAKNILLWDHDAHRARFVFEYHDAGFAAPEPDVDTSGIPNSTDADTE